MPIRVKCANCAKVIRGGDDWAGKIANCPKCGTVIRFPTLPPSDDDADAAQMKFLEQALGDLTEQSKESIESSQRHESAKSSVVITGVDVPFNDLITFFVRAYVAAAFAAFFVAAFVGLALGAVALFLGGIDWLTP
jgi:hypothetical protein